MRILVDKKWFWLKPPPESQSCDGCTLKDASNKECNRLGDLIGYKYPELQEKGLGGCMIPNHVLVEDTPEEMVKYLEHLVNGDDYDEEDEDE